MRKRQNKSLPCRWFYMSLKIMFIYINFSFDFLGLGPVYMEAGLARLARQPGKRDLAV